jgi:hypothetical protein
MASTTGVAALIVRMRMGRKTVRAQILALNFIEFLLRCGDITA